MAVYRLCEHVEAIHKLEFENGNEIEEITWELFRKINFAMAGRVGNISEIE
jgi:hypothetical protein